MTRIILLLLCLAFFIAYTSLARQQKPYPVIGQPLPAFSVDVFTGKEKKVRTLKDYEGKHLLLYFFGPDCAVSFDALPRIKSITDQYPDQLTMLMIGIDTESKELYDKYNARYKFGYGTAYDPALHKRFEVKYAPHILWIDNKGNVKAISSASGLTDTNIKSFIKNEDLRIPHLVNRLEAIDRPYDYDMDKPLLVNNNGGPDSAFLFRSMLAPWTSKITCANRPYISTRWGNQVQLVCMTVAELYDYAYNDTIFHNPQYEWPSSYGIFYNTPVAEVKDKSLFTKGIMGEYCYSMTLPKAKATTRKMLDVMRADLKNYFGYNVSIETRTMPCWKITATEKAREKLKTKGKDKHLPFRDYADFSLINQPVSVLIAHLDLFHPMEPPFIDETGIEGNIDLHVEAFSKDDLSLIRSALQKHGLDLVKGEKEFRVIVIKD